ncbi:DUF998 domain-containing protein [Streptomyces sp. NPDC058773]|uniref:DUF998 domain-containing protein n=1 Tax=Streptomyces sp. NPDC058773 TaxID=3346632 RepID=UPI0036B90520
MDLGLDMTPVPGTARTSTPGALLFAAAAVLYNSWLLEFLLPTGLDPRHSYVSELYAADQPYRPLFGAIESGCAVLVVPAAVLAYGRAAGRWVRMGRPALVGFGLSSLADVLLPMRCAPSREPGCEPVHLWHTVTSALAHFFLFASMALLSHAAAAEGAELPLIRRWGPRVLAVALLTALCTVGPLLGHPGWHGIPQRLHLLLVGAWFALLAAESARNRTGIGNHTGTGTGIGTRIGTGTSTAGCPGVRTTDPDDTAGPFHRT